MKGLKLDTKKLISNTAGNAAAVVVYNGINRIPFVQKISKPAIKGLVTIGIARFGIPWLAGMAGLNKGKNAGMVTGAEEGLATIGVATLGNAVAPNLFPKISGYEDESVMGLGLIADDDGVEGLDGVDGYEDESVMGGDDW